MMLYPSLAELLEKVDSRYMLVNVIARRAREISEIAEETEQYLDEKSVSIAIKEIAEGKVRVVKNDDDEAETVTKATVENVEEADNTRETEVAEEAEETESVEGTDETGDLDNSEE